MDIIKNINISKVVADITTAVKDGLVNPLEAYVSLKKLEEIVKQDKSKIDEEALSEANKYPEKSFNFSDVEITKKNSAGRYDYSNIPEIVKKEKELKELKETYKAASKYDITDLNTGEILNAPIYKHGKEILSIKLNK